MITVTSIGREKIDTPVIYSCRVLRFVKFLPKGPTADQKGFRERDLVQLWTDPGGTRTLALSSLRLGVHRRKRQPKEKDI